MTLDDIRDGQVVLIDANIVLYAVRRASGQCTTLLRRVANRDIVGAIPVIQWAEIMHRLMVAEARDHAWISGPNPASQLASQPHRIRALRRYAEAMRDLMASGIQVELVERDDLLSALHLQKQWGLMTNDALLAAVAERMRVVAVASADRRLAEVDFLRVYAPSDLA
jgi:predicted nucleic acid-binding protein